MKISYHWLHSTALGIDATRLKDLMDILHLPPRLFSSFTNKNGSTIYTYGVPGTGCSESVSIVTPNTPDSYTKIKLTGTYFDTFHAFDLAAYRDFITSQQGNHTRADIAFLDVDRLLDASDYFGMSERDLYQSYITGTAVQHRKKENDRDPSNTNRKGVPDIHSSHGYIHYGDVNSSSYVRVYTPKGMVKFELCLQDKDYNALLLDWYTTDTMERFGELAKSALVKAINFVEPESMPSRRYKQIASWERFLGGEVKPINWTSLAPPKPPPHEDAAFIFKTVNSAVVRLKNCLNKYGKMSPELQLVFDGIALQTEYTPTDTTLTWSTPIEF